MYYRSRRADLSSEEDLEHIHDLHHLTFGPDTPQPELDYGAWWLVFPSEKDFPIAFGGVVACKRVRAHGYLKRAGVLEAHTGHGLQRRLIRMRESWARREGLSVLVTDTSRDSIASSNNLIKSGYKLYEPEQPWGVAGALYWRKVLDA